MSKSRNHKAHLEEKSESKRPGCLWPSSWVAVLVAPTGKSAPNLKMCCLKAREKTEEGGKSLLRPTDTFDANNIKSCIKRKSTSVSPLKNTMAVGFSLTWVNITMINSSQKWRASQISNKDITVSLSRCLVKFLEFSGVCPYCSGFNIPPVIHTFSQINDYTEF